MSKLSRFCGFCHSSTYHTPYVFSDYRLIRCTNCGLLRRNVIFPRSQLKKIFSRQYFFEEQKNYFSGCFQSGQLSENRKVDFLNRLRLLSRHFPRKKSPPKKILDVGCATGLFLQLARNDGWRVYGVEISPLAAAFAQKQFHLPIFVGTLEEAKLPSHSFSVITSWEVLPYIEDPRSFFQEVNRLLRPGGLLAFQLTVVDSLLHYLANLIYQLSRGTVKFIAGRGYPYQNAYHFTRVSIRAFLSQSNFQILSEENIEIDYRLSALPPIFLPLINLVSLAGRLTGKTIQYRVIARKPY